VSKQTLIYVAIVAVTLVFADKLRSLPVVNKLPTL